MAISPGRYSIFELQIEGVRTQGELAANILVNSVREAYHIYWVLE